MATKKQPPKKTGKSVPAPKAKSAAKAAPSAKKPAAGKVAPKAAAKSVKPAAKAAAPKKEVKAPAKATKPVAKPAAKPAKPAPAKVVSAKVPAKAEKPIQKPAAPAKDTKSTKMPAKKVEAPKAKKAEAPPPKKAEVPKEDVYVTPPPPQKAREPKKSEVPQKPIKVPKTSATGKVPYEPDFTHSVLDTPVKEDTTNGAPTMRYSDGELMEFRNLIQRKLDAAKKELAYLQGLITRKDEMGGDNDDGRYMTMEDGSLSMEREQLSQMASRQITFIDHLEKALMRIENKTYGICRVTGKLIEKARLRAVPHATLSMEAKVGKARAV